MVTLKELITEHLEWADLPIAVYDGSGPYYTSRVYSNETCDDPDADMEDPNTKKYTVLVFDAS